MHRPSGVVGSWFAHWALEDVELVCIARIAVLAIFTPTLAAAAAIVLGLGIAP